MKHTFRRKTLATLAALSASAAALSAALSGCGTADASVTGISPDTTIEMIAGTQDSSYYLSMECGAAVRARELGINLTVVGGATATANDQIALVQGVIVGNPDALIIAPDATAGRTSAGPGTAAGRSLGQALFVVEENDTKVVFVNTSVDDNDLGASRIVSDDAQGGRLAADSLGALAGGSGTVAVIGSPSGGGPAATRIAAFRAEMAARYPRITVLATAQDTAGTAAGAASLMAAVLREHRHLSGVLAVTQAAAQGAITAIGRARLTGAVKVATFGAGPFQMTGLDTGTIAVAVAEEPAVQGADAVDQAVNAIAGRKVEPYVTTPMIAITARNMNSAAIRPYIYDGTCVSSLRGYMTS
jgi:ribose transport system substrate-binding protein